MDKKPKIEPETCSLKEAPLTAELLRCFAHVLHFYILINDTSSPLDAARD
jgi:hypothetical protein